MSNQRPDGTIYGRGGVDVREPRRGGLHPGVLEAAAKADDDQLASVLRDEAGAICDEDVEISLGIGRHGLELLEAIAAKKDGPVNVLTHCNAGGLATAEYGTALSVFFTAQVEGKQLHVFVYETRSRPEVIELVLNLTEYPRLAEVRFDGREADDRRWEVE